MAAVNPTRTNSDPLIAPLIGDSQWASPALTYSFPSSASAYASPYGSNEPSSNFAPLNAAQQQAAKAAFAQFSAISLLTFSAEAATSATIRIAQSDVPATAWGYLPHSAAEGGDIWLNGSSGIYAAPLKGNYAYLTFLHEIGHALGLEHPHENGMPAASDAMQNTVMSYRSYADSGLGYVNERWGYAQSLMTYDIAAVQQLYGANFAHEAGSTTYSWGTANGQMYINGTAQGVPGGNRIFQTVWDGGGTDTFDFSNYTSALNVDLRPGHWSTVSDVQLAKLHYNGSQAAPGNIANPLLYNGDIRSLIENVVGGSGSDSLAGNQAQNWLVGGAGNDRLTGYGNSDTLLGGSGFDTAIFDFSIRSASTTLVDSYLAVSSATQSDRTSSIERFAFTDKAVILADGEVMVDDLFYLTRNRDVLDSGMESEAHFASYGWREGRDPNELFDTSDYLNTYRDVAAAGMNPLEHYDNYGWLEGRDPSGAFDTDAYLSAYGDVAAAGLNPLDHYLGFGIYEGRDAFSDWIIG